MYFTELLKNNLNQRKNKIPFSLSYWPDEFYLEEKTESHFQNIKNFTNKDYLLIQKTSGSSGWEYGINIYFSMDSLYFSKPIPGNYFQVNVNETAKVSTVTLKEENKLYFDIQIGEYKIKSRKYDIAKLDKNILFGKVAAIHTHPKFYLDKQNYQYGFFSAQDIKLLLNDTSEILGLINGNTIWFACRTDVSKEIPLDILNQISGLISSSPTKAVENFIHENCKPYGIIFYRGEFGSKISKI